MASKPSGVRGDGGGRDAYGVAENLEGGRYGVGGGVESLQGIDTPGVDTLPRGDKTPGVATKGDGVTEEDRWGRGGDGNHPTTQVSEESRADCGNDGMARRLRTAVTPRPRDTVADNDSAGPLPRQSIGTNSARPENGMHFHHEYGLLVLEELEGG